MGRIFSLPPSTFEIDHAHAFVAGVKYAESHDGDLPHNAFWRDLERRYDRNADAFAINHPNFKLAFDRIMLDRAEVQSLPCEVQPLVPEVQSLATQAVPYVDCRAVPEPTSLSLGVAAILFLLVVLKKGQP